MIKGYLLALCSGSSFDTKVKNFTLFNLIENVGVPQEALAQTLPFELHFYCLVEPGARNADFEMRVVRVDEQGGSDPGDPLPFNAGEGSHFRMRAMAFRLPRAFGQYLLHVEWRRRGQEAWNIDPLVWPLSVGALPQPEAQAGSSSTMP